VESLINKTTIQIMVISIRSILLILLVAFNLNVSSQTLKTYTGNYEDGSATYQYYENKDYERVYHGTFKYSESNLTVIGQFKNNLKDGFWSYEYKNNNYNYDPIDYTKLTGTFSNGKMEKDWSYLYYRKNKKSGKFEEYKEMSVQFHNNNFIGKLYLTEDHIYHNNGIGKMKIKGNFNNDGLIDSIWSLTYTQNGYDFETYFKFKYGILYGSFSRNLSNGNIIENFDSTGFINQFINNYDTLSNISSVNSNYFSMAMYQLDLGERNEGADFLDNDYFMKTKELKEMFSHEIESPHNMFGFNSVFSSKTDASVELSSILVFWVNLHNGDFFKIKKGSDVKLIYPKCAVLRLNETKLKEIEKKKKQIEEDKREKKEEEVRIEKERIEVIARKEKFEGAVQNGNKFFETKKYKQALAEYNSANAIEISNEISAKIKATQKEIDRIDSLQKLRLETYSYLKSKYETIAPEMTSLKLSLQDKKKVYGKNYELCMNLLNSKFPTYFSSVNAMFNANKTTGLEIEDTWNETDQDALGLLTKFKDEFKQYEKFHYAVKTAFETENKDQLKLLKSSDDPKEIISKF
jgi:hypothetical protein